MSVRRRRPLLVTAVLAVGAGLVLTACGPDNTDQAAGPKASPTTAAVTPAPTGAAPAAGSPTAPATAAASHTPTSAPHTPSASTSARPGGGSAPADATPCDINNLSIHVTARPGAPSQRVIEVHNTGAKACSLSSSPGVNLGNSTARDQSNNIRPVLASGTLRFPVPAGQNAYVVIDLNPSGATTGTTPDINEINVLADQDDTNMPLAATHNFPLTPDTRVLNPHMGNYRATVAEAVTSMAAAGK
ncbi:DUF4232 domain-containing protein [Kitasatospora sp. NBC_01300]|uniref:DUF4232 domain-containing protein n=1 Tax=Kitasatospora sp. NBC_01300 TaxID=2903574 RepID=UPI002F90C49F|nr:hypothetical protein OG556_39225 [Kitasatospora sp. NBC_01300]